MDMTAERAITYLGPGALFVLPAQQCALFRPAEGVGRAGRGCWSRQCWSWQRCSADCRPAGSRAPRRICHTACPCGLEMPLRSEAGRCGAHGDGPQLHGILPVLPGLQRGTRLPLGLCPWGCCSRAPRCLPNLPLRWRGRHQTAHLKISGSFLTTLTAFPSESIRPWSVYFARRWKTWQNVSELV